MGNTEKTNAYDAITLCNNSNDVKSSGGRNYSLDLLRIISMIMIIFLHINSHGGLIEYWSLDSLNGILLRFIHVCCMVSVNVYVLITGYFLVYQKFRFSRIFKIVLETVAYTWIIGIVLIINGDSLSIGEYLGLLLPVSYSSYWFVTAYIGLSLLSPFLNKLLVSLNKSQHLLLVILLLLMHSLLRDILVSSEPFATSKGYSLVWFITLYVVGAFIRKYVNLDSVKHPFAIYLGICLLMFALWALLSVLSTRFSFIEKYSLCSYWTRYNSILNVLASVFLFTTFARKNIQTKSFCKGISIIAPLTFGVYLIHDNAYVRDYLWLECFKVNTFENNALLIPKSLLVVVAIFAGCITIDFIRKTFFDVLFYKRKYFSDLMRKLDDLPYRIMERFSE